jgi:AcrR family transcriptional regulator
MNYRPLELPPVLRCSLDAFVEHGYHGTAVRDIARRLNQTVPMIYYYYENKQALLTALLDESLTDLLARCGGALESVGEDPVERLSTLIRCIVLYVTNRRQFVLLDQEVRSLEGRNRPTYIAKRDELEGMLVACIAPGVKSGVFAVDDPSTAARALLAMCRGIAGWFRAGGPMTPAGVAELYVGFALGLVGYTR